MIFIEITVEIVKALLPGAIVTLQLTLYSALLALVLAFIAGFGRMSKIKPIRWLASFLIEFFRGTSLLVQLFWLYFALPLFGIRLPTGIVGILALGVNYGAYGAEVVRGAIQSVPKGQHEAGIALNMTPWQRMRYIIVPQAIPTMIPSFGNLLIELLKGTALVSLITIADMTYMANTLRNSIAEHNFLIYGVLLVMYFMIGYPLTLFMRWLERKFSAGRV